MAWRGAKRKLCWINPSPCHLGYTFSPTNASVFKLHSTSGGPSWRGHDGCFPFSSLGFQSYSELWVSPQQTFCTLPRSWSRSWEWIWALKVVTSTWDNSLYSSLIGPHMIRRAMAFLCFLLMLEMSTAATEITCGLKCVAELREYRSELQTLIKATQCPGEKAILCCYKWASLRN